MYYCSPKIAEKCRQKLNNSLLSQFYGAYQFLVKIGGIPQCLNIAKILQEFQTIPPAPMQKTNLQH